GLLRERPWQHELGFEHGFGPLHDAVEGGSHPRDGRMLDPTANAPNASAGIALVPGAIELLGRGPKLYDQIARQILRLGFSPFLTPELDQGRFVVAHDDPGVRAADEGTTIFVGACRRCRYKVFG